ncbi:MAG: sigma-70 family RNA polymerase sigma factor [Planctomycetes bacterium]|nr:sigma-70 family RNA polymerase sigma factor [Planctomycetota bacterium]
MPNIDTQIGGSGDYFPTTMWGDIIKLKDKNSADYKEKMNYLISIYWKPVYKCIRIYWNKSNEDAKDLTQEFFSRFMQKDLLQSVLPEKGKFRTYLRHLLKNFLLDEKKKWSADKRGGESKFVSLNKLEEETVMNPETQSPDDFFDREWAKCVLERSVEMLKKKLSESGKEVYFKIFETYDLNTSSDSNLSYKELGDNCGLKEHDVKNYLSYARQLLRKIIKKEISTYVSDPDSVEEELRTLLSL